MSAVKIGRTSRRDVALEAKRDNCFFDSPVMSRDHAEIKVDWFFKASSFHVCTVKWSTANMNTSGFISRILALCTELT